MIVSATILAVCHVGVYLDLAVRSQPQAIAGPAEMIGHAADESETPLVPRDRIVSRSVVECIRSSRHCRMSLDNMRQ